MNTSSTLVLTWNAVVLVYHIIAEVHVLCGAVFRTVPDHWYILTDMFAIAFEEVTNIARER